MLLRITLLDQKYCRFDLNHLLPNDNPTEKIFLMVSQYVFIKVPIIFMNI